LLRFVDKVERTVAAMRKTITIAMVINSDRAEEGYAFAEGAMLYINAHRHLHLVEIPCQTGEPPAGIDWDRFDGIIAWVDVRDDWILRIRKPKVSCSGAFPVEAMPIVAYDGKALFKEVVAQAMRLHVSELLFLRPLVPGTLYQQADAKLREWLKPAGIGYQAYDDPGRPEPVAQSQRLQFPDPRQEKALAEVLNRLQKPALVFSDVGSYGHLVCKMAEHLKFSIPGEIAVLVAGDSRQARQGDPALSVIDLPQQQLGFEAIKRLHAEIEPSSPDPLPAKILLSPPPAILSTSTDRPFTSPHISAAAEFIRLYACDGLTVQELADHMKLHRSHLTRQFTRHYGKSPLQAIQEERVQRIHDWLDNTDLAIRRIAELSGFKSNVAFYQFFKNATGQTPTEYRKQQLRKPSTQARHGRNQKNGG
jgi:AraC-like DNA-binding protein